MSLEQRKSVLISWISSMKNEELLIRLEELRSVEGNVPSSILELLNLSSKSKSLTKHTSAKQLIRQYDSKCCLDRPSHPIP